MIEFSKNRTRCIGRRLKMARFSHGATLDDISSVLKIQKKYLQYLENSQFSLIPEPIYRESILKAYATYLNCDWDTLRQEYEKEHHGVKDSVGANTLTGKKGIPKLWDIPRIIKNSCTACALFLCFLYIFFLGYTAMVPPELSIETPQDQIITSKDHLLVKGRAEKNDVQIMINGERVPKGQDGYFQQEVILRKGLNSIHISARKRFSRDAQITRRVIFQKNDSFASTQTTTQ